MVVVNANMVIQWFMFNWMNITNHMIMVNHSISVNGYGLLWTIELAITNIYIHIGNSEL